jgi:hypothetical protein
MIQDELKGLPRVGAVARRQGGLSPSGRRLRVLASCVFASRRRPYVQRRDRRIERLPAALSAEAIAAPANGADQVLGRLAAVLAQCGAQPEYRLTEIGLFNDAVVPNGVKEFLFLDQSARVFNQMKQHAEQGGRMAMLAPL